MHRVTSFLIKLEFSAILLVTSVILEKLSGLFDKLLLLGVIVVANESCYYDGDLDNCCSFSS